MSYGTVDSDLKSHEPKCPPAPQTSPKCFSSSQLMVASTVINALLGVSIFAMPWGFQESGLLAGVVIVASVAYLSYTTAKMLLVAQRHFFDTTGKIMDYPEIAASALMAPLWSAVVKTATIISCIGTCTAYLIFIFETLAQSLGVDVTTIALVLSIPLVLMSWIRTYRELAWFTIVSMCAFLGTLGLIFYDGYSTMATTNTAADAEAEDGASVSGYSPGPGPIPLVLPRTMGKFVGLTTFSFCVHYCTLSVGAEALTREKERERKQRHCRHQHRHGDNLDSTTSSSGSGSGSDTSGGSSSSGRGTNQEKRSRSNYSAIEEETRPLVTVPTSTTNHSYKNSKIAYGGTDTPPDIEAEAEAEAEAEVKYGNIGFAVGDGIPVGESTPQRHYTARIDAGAAAGAAANGTTSDSYGGGLAYIDGTGETGDGDGGTGGGTGVPQFTSSIAAAYVATSTFVGTVGLVGFLLYRNHEPVTYMDGSVYRGCEAGICDNIIIEISPGLYRNLVGYLMSIVLFVGYMVLLGPAREHIEGGIMRALLRVLPSLATSIPVDNTSPATSPTSSSSTTNSSNSSCFDLIGRNLIRASLVLGTVYVAAGWPYFGAMQGTLGGATDTLLCYIVPPLITLRLALILPPAMPQSLALALAQQSVSPVDHHAGIISTMEPGGGGGVKKVWYGGSVGGDGGVGVGGDVWRVLRHRVSQCWCLFILAWGSCALLYTIATIVAPASFA